MARSNKTKTKQLPARYQAGFLGRMDGRTDLCKRLQSAFDEIMEDIGGADGQSHLRVALVERCVFLEFQLRRWEEKILAGTLPDEAIGRWIQATNSLLGLSKTLGLGRTRLQNAIDALYSDPDDSPDAPESGRSGPVQGSEGDGG